MTMLLYFAEFEKMLVEQRREAVMLVTFAGSFLGALPTALLFAC